MLWTSLRVAAKRATKSNGNDISFPADFALTLARRGGWVVPLSVKRRLFMPNVPKALKPGRFTKDTTSLYQKAVSKGFVGYWICKGAPGKPKAASACDLVIYYMHGGGYTSGSPSTCLGTWLRIAEILESKGVSVAIFGLNYSLAPEAQFSTQLNQALAGYMYLLEDESVDPSRLATMGDSAGGHLNLCLLAGLYKHDLPKPEAGVVLLSPWIDLLCSHGDSFVYNIENDFLNRDTLVEWAKWLIGKDPTGEASSFVDFGQPRPGDQSWSKIMPKKVWISAGSHEIFLGDITRFVESLKADGVLVDFDVAKGRCHTWQQVEDNLQSQKYFKMTDPVLPTK